MKKERGVNLLECLLVLLVIAVICVFSIRRYQDYRRRIQIATIKSDIASLQSALNRYYHEIGCQVGGIFAGNIRPSLSDLGLTLPGRPPQVPLNGQAYQALIREMGPGTANKKPVYWLQVSAEFASHYSKQRMLWYQKTLGANKMAGTQLIWTILPGSMKAAPGTELWVMNPQRAQFRQKENDLRQQLSTITPDGLSSPLASSPAYCVH